MKIELFKKVALTIDIPESHLERGDIATVVDYLVAEDNGELGYALEFFNTIGETVDVLFLPASAVEPLAADGIWHSRHFAQAA